MAKKEATTKASNYSASIVEASRELTAKERVMFKDLGNAESMVDFATSAREQGGKATIDVADWAVISVHNEATDDVDYTNYLKSKTKKRRKNYEERFNHKNHQRNKGNSKGYQPSNRRNQHKRNSAFKSP